MVCGVRGARLIVYVYVCRIIFELIKGEMDYVKDLENIDVVRPI